MPVAEQPVETLAAAMASFAKDPVSFQRYAYPWGRGALVGHGSDRLRTWQIAVGNAIRDHLQDPTTRFQPCQIAVASGHDIGKSAEVAMLSNWALSTCEDTKVLITANTDTQ